MSEGDVRTRWTELLELDDMLHKLVETALKLAPGVERHDDLFAIGRFRERIAVDALRLRPDTGYPAKGRLARRGDTAAIRS
jgi:hypothetical protein